MGRPIELASGVAEMQPELSELVNLNEESTSRLLTQVCTLPAVVRALITHACSPRASAHPFLVGRLWCYSFMDGPMESVVVTCGQNFVAVASTVQFEHGGMCYASSLHALSRMVLVAAVSAPQLRRMDTTSVAWLRTIRLRDRDTS